MQSEDPVPARKTRILPETILEYEAESGSSQSSSTGEEVTEKVLEDIIATVDSLTPKSSQQSDDIFSSQESFSYSQEVEKVVSAQGFAKYLVGALSGETIRNICNTHAMSMDSLITPHRAEDKVNLVFDVTNCVYKNPDLIRDLARAALIKLRAPGAAMPPPVASIFPAPEPVGPSTPCSRRRMDSPRPSSTDCSPVGADSVSHPAKKVRLQIDDLAPSPAP